MGGNFLFVFNKSLINNKKRRSRRKMDKSPFHRDLALSQLSTTRAIVTKFKESFIIRAQWISVAPFCFLLFCGDMGMRR